MFINIIKSIFFGIVEGITEWLPISSTGHLIIFNQIWPLDVSKEFYEMFEVLIQLGAIMAVVLIFFNRIWPFAIKNNKYPLTKNGPLKYVKKDKFILWLKIIVSCLPAIVIVALGIDEWAEQYLYNATVVAIMLIVVGVAFIAIELFSGKKNYRVTKISQITYKDALIIGLFQLIAAILPGTSRSGATIIGALLIGVSRVVSAEYTFYLAIPAMAGASLLKLVKFGLAFSFQEVIILLIGMITAFIVSLFVIKYLMNYVKNHTFVVFGIYRIILGIIVLVFITPYL